MLTKNEIKRIQSLSRKKNREEAKLFVAEGEKLVKHLLQMGIKKEALYTTSLEVFPAATVINTADMKRISFLKSPSNVLGVFAKPVLNNPPFSGRFNLVLDGIRDPGNMGTIIRLADWFGVAEVICTPDCVDVFNEKVVQASMGSVATVQVAEMERLFIIQSAIQSGYSLVGTDLEGESVYHSDFSDKISLVIGNEGQGLSPELEEALNKKITIPASRSAKAESLNAAVATSVIVSEIFRRRG